MFCLQKSESRGVEGLMSISGCKMFLTFVHGLFCFRALQTKIYFWRFKKMLSSVIDYHDTINHYVDKWVGTFICYSLYPLNTTVYYLIEFFREKEI